MKSRLSSKFWLALVLFSLMGQVAWTVENMYLNVFIYKMFNATASQISLMVALSAVTATLTTVFIGALSDKIGKPVVVNFWATWCGPCRSEMPVFDAAYKEYGDEVEFMMVNLTDGYNDIPEKVAEFVDANGYSFPIYHDLEQNAARVYSVYSIPMTLFVNADGSIYDTVIGAMNEKSFMVRLEAIMK